MGTGGRAATKDGGLAKEGGDAYAGQVSATELQETVSVTDG